jgi:Integrase zinc binding domain
VGKIVLGEKIFRIATTHHRVTKSHMDQKLLRQVKECKEIDRNITMILNKIKTNAPSKLTKELEDWTTQDGVTLYQGLIYVPKDDSILWDIVKMHHDNPAAGHPGRSKTLELVTCSYWWLAEHDSIHKPIHGSMQPLSPKQEHRS